MARWFDREPLFLTAKDTVRETTSSICILASSLPAATQAAPLTWATKHNLSVTSPILAPILTPTVSGISHKFAPSFLVYHATLVTSLLDLLYFMWLLTSCPAAMAGINDNSPASTEPATMVARSLAFDPGHSLLAPFTPSRLRHADWEASWVPPPTVPTWENKTQLSELDKISTTQMD